MATKFCTAHHKHMFTAHHKHMFFMSTFLWKVSKVGKNNFLTVEFFRMV